MTLESQQSVYPETPKIDEVKRYEKIYDMSKEMFTYSESVIKGIEEKSRNNLTAAIAIMGFAFLIRKPPDIKILMWYDFLAIMFASVCVGCIYYCHLEVVKPKSFKLPSEKQLANLRTETNYPNGVIRKNFEDFQNFYGQNLSLIRSKGEFLKRQQKFLGAVLFFALAYIIMSGIPTSDPKNSTLNPSWPTTINAPNPSHPNQIQTPGPSPTTSTSIKEMTSKKTIIGPVIVPMTEKSADKIKP